MKYYLVYDKYQSSRILGVWIEGETDETIEKHAERTSHDLQVEVEFIGFPEMYLLNHYLRVKDHFNKPNVDPEIINSIQRYVEHRIPTGGFLKAILENDLYQAFSRADSNNKHRVFNLLYYISSTVPHDAWGSKEIVKNWLEN